MIVTIEHIKTLISVCYSLSQVWVHIPDSTLKNFSQFKTSTTPFTIVLSANIALFPCRRFDVFCVQSCCHIAAVGYYHWKVRRRRSFLFSANHFLLYEQSTKLIWLILPPFSDTFSIAFSALPIHDEILRYLFVLYRNSSMPLLPASSMIVFAYVIMRKIMENLSDKLEMLFPLTSDNIWETSWALARFL